MIILFKKLGLIFCLPIAADGRGAAAAAEEIVDKEGAAIGAESESETEDKDSSDVRFTGFYRVLATFSFLCFVVLPSLTTLTTR